MRLEAGSRLATLTDSPVVRVNSYHHQVLDRVADSLVVTARSADGEIEAVEMPGERFFVGVQWHPEKSLKDGDRFSASIFKALRAAMR